MCASAGEDLVEGAVELAIAAGVEAVTDGLTGGGRDRGGAGETGEGGFAGARGSVKEPTPESANPVLAPHGAGHLAAHGPARYELVLATENAPTHPGE